MTIGQDGGVSYIDQDARSATFSQRVVAGYLALGKFSNEGGLQRTGGSLWLQSASSGAATIGTPSTNGFGQTNAGTESARARHAAGQARGQHPRRARIEVHLVAKAQRVAGDALVPGLAGQDRLVRLDARAAPRTGGSRTPLATPARRRLASTGSSGGTCQTTLACVGIAPGGGHERDGRAATGTDTANAAAGRRVRERARPSAPRPSRPARARAPSGRRGSGPRRRRCAG